MCNIRYITYIICQSRRVKQWGLEKCDHKTLYALDICRDIYIYSIYIIYATSKIIKQGNYDKKCELARIGSGGRLVYVYYLRHSVRLARVFPMIFTINSDYILTQHQPASLCIEDVF
jgi:hypothetical protein